MTNFSRAEGMVETIRRQYNLRDEKVLSAMLKVSRERFVRREDLNLAYSDNALSIGFGQTISQPYTVAFMTHLLIKGKIGLKRKKVLEIGTGSGYQAAVLSELFGEVYTIEIIPELSVRAGNILVGTGFKDLGIKNVEIKTGHGAEGWKEKAPFDAIVVTAGVEEVPKALFEQLKVGGVLVVPVGSGADKIMARFSKDKAGLKKEEFGIFNFVPFIRKEA